MAATDPRLATCRTFTELLDTAEELGLTAGLAVPSERLESHTRHLRAWLRGEIDAVLDQLRGASVEDLLEEADELLRGRQAREARRALLAAVAAHLSSSQRSSSEREELPSREVARAKMNEYWQQRAREAAARKREEQAAPAGSGRHGDPGRRDRAALLSWAKEHGVDHKLRERVGNTLAKRDPQLFTGTINYAVESTTLEDLLTTASWVDHRTGKEHPKLGELRAAAWTLLVEEAEQVRRRVDDEVKWLANPIAGGPKEMAFADRLRACRARIRARVPPVELRSASGQFTMQLDDDLLVRYEEGGWGAPPESASLVVSDGDEALVVQCTCIDRGLCRHALIVVDSIMLRLFDASNDPLRKAIVEVLATPSWRRALARLDASLESSRKEREQYGENLLWWRISTGESLFALTPLLQKRGKRGGMLKPKHVDASVLLDDYGDSLSASDRELAELSDAAQTAREVGAGGEGLLLRALAKLVGHPRVVFDDDVESPVAVSEGKMELSVGTESDRFVLGVLVEGRRLSYEELTSRLIAFGLGDALIDIDFPQRRCVIVRIPSDLRAAFGAIKTLERGIPLAHRDELLRRLPVLGGGVSLVLDRSLAGRELRPERAIVLQLTPGAPHALEVQVYLRPLAGGPLVRPGEGPLELVASSPDRELVFTRREIGAEAEWTRARLADLIPGLEAGGRSWSSTIAELDDALDLVQRLERAEGIISEWSQPAWRVGRAAVPEDLRVRIVDRYDWFGLEGELEVDGARVSIAALLEATRDKRRYVRVDGEQWIAVGEILRRRIESVEPFAFSGRGGLEVSPIAVEEIESAIGDAGELARTPRWRDAIERLERARSLAPVPPRALKASLRPYQIEGHAWLARLAAAGIGACLADDMGLGKTMQMLAVLLDRAGGGPALVVAPTSVTFNWIRELERFAPSLRAILYRGSERRADLESLGPNDVLVVSYGLLIRDQTDLSAMSYATLVLDEAQAIKNAASRRAKAARMIQADWRVALTGTPLENHLGELWSIFHAVSPLVLGSWEQFKERFAAPIERRQDADRARALSLLLRPFVLRRTKAQVAKDLPPKTEVRIDVVLSPKERDLYDDARLAAIAKLSDIEVGLPEEQQRFHVLAALTRLRQIACHPRLSDARLTVRSSKLEKFVDLARSLVDEGQRVLVFSQFTQHLALVREALEREKLAFLYLDGGTPLAQRAELVDRFQSGEVPIFLISLKAGGTGLNLTAAENVIILDPWWNPAVEDQAADRAHRIGQSKPVTVYRLVSRGTIEESILNLHASKRALVAGVLEGAGAAAAISTDELLAIIKAGAAGADEVADVIEDEAVEPEVVEEQVTSSLPAIVGATEARVEDAAPLDRAIARFETNILREAESGSISDGSARAYLRVARRIGRLAHESGNDGLLSTLDGALRFVSEKVESGALPKSMLPIASVVLRRWIAS